jgi:hypothetical protein
LSRCEITNLRPSIGVQAAGIRNAARFGQYFFVRNSSVRRKAFAIALAAAIAGLVFTAWAQEYSAPPAPEQLAFNIPSQPLTTALQAYGEATGVQVLYESSSANGQRSAPVEGNFTADAALKALLTGTDLKVRYIRPNAITLARPSLDSDLPPASPFVSADLSLEPLRVQASADEGDRSRRDYSEIVRNDVESALRKNAKTRSGNYRFGADLWVDSSRIVRRTELFQSTGDRNRDAAVSATLQGLMISREAPTNAPSPVHVLVVVKTLR